MNLIIPPKVKAGDSVYIISPSAGLIPFTEQRVTRAIENLESLDLHVKFARNASKNKGYLSASIEERVEDIHQAFSDPACSLVLASIGGNHSNQLLEHIDYDLIKNNPKAFVGYSDNTVIHYALFTQSNLQSYYGPCFLTQFGENPEVLPYTVDYFKKALMEQGKLIEILQSGEYTDEVLDWFKNEDSLRPRKLIKNEGISCWRPGSSKGWAFPFTIPSINHILSTKYLPDPTGAILMIDIPEGNSIHQGMSVADFDAWFTDLHISGLLANVCGIIFGRPYKYSKEMIEDLKEVTLRICKDLDFPILYNANFGHSDPIITIPVGSEIQIDSSKQITLSMKILG